TLRQLLFLVPLLIIGWYCHDATDLLVLRLKHMGAFSHSSLFKDNSEEKRRDEYKRDVENAYELLKWRKETQRTLDLCGICGAVVESHGNQHRRHSDQQTQSFEPQMWILRRMLTPHVLLYLTLFVIGVFIGWYIELPIPTLRELPYLALECFKQGFIWWMIENIMESIIHLLLLLVFATGIVPDVLSSFVLSFNNTFVILISVSVAFFLHRLIDNSENILEEIDQLLQQMKVTQRIVEIRLAANASRDDLRNLEEIAVTGMERVRSIKSTSESSPPLSKLIMFVILSIRGEEFIPKVEDTIAIEFCICVVQLLRLESSPPSTLYSNFHS
ncbi:hypothetical protein PENTCL1PPCAC_11069, partial [Pristionchus entomophagus]